MNKHTLMVGAYKYVHTYLCTYIYTAQTPVCDINNLVLWLKCPTVIESANYGDQTYILTHVRRCTNARDCVFCIQLQCVGTYVCTYVYICPCMYTQVHLFCNTVVTYVRSCT